MSAFTDELNAAVTRAPWLAEEHTDLGPEAQAAHWREVMRAEEDIEQVYCFHIYERK